MTSALDSAETITVVRADGTEYDLDECVQRGVDGPAGCLVVPAKRGGNLVVPGSHGELHIPAKKYGPAAVVLQLWIRGVDPDGTIPADTVEGNRLEFIYNLRQLMGLFVVDERVWIRHYLPDGSVRQIQGEVTDTVAPDIRGAGHYSLGQFTVALNCAFPFWSDLEPVTQTVPGGGPVELSAFEGATAPMEDLLLVFGPQSNPRLVQPSREVFVQLNRVIDSGQTITVDTARWEVYGSPGVGGGLYEDLAYGGRGTTRWFALQPEPGGGAPVVELTSTGAASGQVTVTGTRRYKIG